MSVVSYKMKQHSCYTVSAFAILQRRNRSVFFKNQMYSESMERMSVRTYSFALSNSICTFWYHAKGGYKSCWRWAGCLSGMVEENFHFLSRRFFSSRRSFSFLS